MACEKNNQVRSLRLGNRRDLTKIESTVFVSSLTLDRLSTLSYLSGRSRCRCCRHHRRIPMLPRHRSTHPVDAVVGSAIAGESRIGSQIVNREPNRLPAHDAFHIPATQARLANLRVDLRRLCSLIAILQLKLLIYHCHHQFYS